MADIKGVATLEQWVCPNDRQLALRAKLGAGWSVHTNKMASFHKPGTLTADEHEQIMAVVRRAEMAEDTEQERIGRLVDRVDNMKRNAMGNGSTQCILCGDEFGILGATPTHCDDCQKAVCSKCGIDTTNSSKHALWLCKICSENRELWKRSGAWFFKGIPKHTIPNKNTQNNKSSIPQAIKLSPQILPLNSPTHQTQYNTWSRSNRALVSSDEDSSDEGDGMLGSGRAVLTHKRSSDNLDTCDGGSIGSCSLDEMSNANVDLLSTSVERSYGDGRSREEVEHIEQPRSTCSSSMSNEIGLLEIKQMKAKSLKSSSSSVSNKVKSKYGCIEFNLLFDHLHSILQCTLIKGTDLRSMDSNGYSDPYVKLHLIPQTKKVKHRSSTKFKTLNPVWNEIFSYKDFTKDDLKKKTLKIQVLDEDLFSHDFVGECRIALSVLIEGRSSHFCLPLHEKIIDPDIRSLNSVMSLSDDRGRINISLCYNPGSRHLIVGVQRCFNLRAMDTNGFSDPYVKLYLLPDKSKKSKNKTRIKRKTLNPVYNEEFTYLVHPNDLALKSLSISVWDHDFGKNDFIGQVELGLNSSADKLHHWRRMINNFTKTTLESHALLNKTQDDLNSFQGI